MKESNYDKIGETNYENEKFDKAFTLLSEETKNNIEIDPFDEALAFKFPDQINEILSQK